jgi:hypothetical protein
LRLPSVGDVNYDIAAHISPVTSLVVLTDAQGHSAIVTSGAKTFGNIVFYDISAVLMSGGCRYCNAHVQLLLFTNVQVVYVQMAPEAVRRNH